MKQGTKRRIVGTVVLLALALTFLPMIFDGQGSYQPTLSSRIPQTPVVPVMPEPQQSRPVIIGDTETQSPSPAPDEEADSPGGAEVVTSEPVYTRETPQLAESGLPQGWSVRLGSFAEAANAQTLVQRLQGAGYRAYTKSLTSAEGELTGVYVGPWLERSLGEDYRRQLQAEFQLSGIVVRYEVDPL